MKSVALWSALIACVAMVSAHRGYLAVYPNVRYVPCPADYPCCMSSGVCEAFGQ
jgi:hypothetical protein